MTLDQPTRPLLTYDQCTYYSCPTCHKPITHWKLGEVDYFEPGCDCYPSKGPGVTFKRHTETGTL